MNRKQTIKEIANIIQNFRKDELPIQLDSRHVEKWVSQFSQETQDVILFETLHVLNEWYFTDLKIDDILDTLNRSSKYTNITVNEITIND